MFQLKLKIGVTLFLLSIFLNFQVNTENVYSAICQNCTHLMPRIDVFKRHVLSRRKRGIIFPKKAFVLITQSFTKAIIDGRPPGIAYSIEFDMYSELPDTLKGWEPTILKDKIKTEQEVKVHMTENKNNVSDIVESHGTPSNTESNYAYLSTPMPIEVYDDLQITPNDWSIENEYPSNYHHPSSAKFSPRLYTLMYKRKNKLKHQQEMENFYKKHFWKNTDRKYSKPKYTAPKTYTTEDINHWPPIKEIYESEADVPLWKYHRAYRERHHLFEQLETLGKIFNFDVKSCIQRGMCEMRSKLKPYGESLMEDIVRIILTIPKKLSFSDDYSFDFAQHEEKGTQNCAKHFKDSCPYGVLDFLTNTLRTVNFDDRRGENTDQKR